MPRARGIAVCATVALMSMVSCASAAALNLTGTWLANYHCEAGPCPGGVGTNFPATLMLTQGQGSEVVTGKNEGGEEITGTLTGNTFDYHSAFGGYSSEGELTVAEDGLSFSGPLHDNNGTSGTYTATRDPALPGSLSQLSAPFDCVGETTEPSEGDTCGTLVASGTHDVFQVQVSPDGKNVYSVAINGDLIEYARNQATGALRVIGCITATTDHCAPENIIENAVEIANPSAIALSPDGKDAYVTGTGKNAIVELERNQETGLLTLMNEGKACVTEEASGECEVKSAKGLHSPYGVALSPGGEDVYVTAVGGEAVAELERNTSTGVLTPISGEECIGGPTSGCPVKSAIGMFEPIGIVVSPSGKNVYVAAGAEGEAGAVVAFEREAGGGLKQLEGEEACISEKVVGCKPGIAVQGAEDIVISPDEKNLYATSAHENAVVELERVGLNGGLGQLAEPNACVTTETIGGCTKAISVGDSRGLAISPNGENLYVGSAGESGVAAFMRNAQGALEQLPEPAACVTSNLSGCGAVELLGLQETRRVAISPDGTNLYLAGQKAGAIVELARAIVPTVSGIEPNQGPYAGGAEITVRGTGFVAGDTVDFGTKPASEVHVSSAETLTARSPAGSGTVDVVVSAAAGPSATSPADEYAYGRLGGLDLASYCESLGDNGKDSNNKGPAVLMREGEAVEGPEYAYDNWGCVQDSGTVVPVATEGPAPSMDNACVVAFPGVAAHAEPENPNNAFSWNCYEGAPPEEKGGGGNSKGGSGGGGGGGSEPIAKVSLVTPILPSVPAPVLAKTGNVAPVSGTVRVRVPGSSSFVALSEVRQIPFGSVIDATNGSVSVTSTEPDGATQTGTFFDGEFILTQGKNGVLLATLTGGNFSVCPTAKERSHVARASAKHAAPSHVVRKLWANAHGSFSTKGNYAAGAVLGTEWLTEDLCDGTLIKVTRDKVAVTNLVNHHKVTVKTGHQYLAKAP